MGPAEYDAAAIESLCRYSRPIQIISGYSNSMTISATASLGELVTEDSRRSRVLEKLGLDYCCNGADSLAVASAAAGLDIDQVIAALDLPDAPPASTPAGDTTGLAHDIVDTHHAYMWEEMPRLATLVEKVYRVHGERHPELEQVRDAFFRAVGALEPHMTAEERSVFPTIAKLEKGQPASGAATLNETLDALIDEHQQVGDLFHEIKSLTNNYTWPADGCNSYKMMLEGLREMELDLHEHIHKENNILFPAARRFVTA
jgi:regulator of cell morphogenesis and NO signaling